MPGCCWKQSRKCSDGTLSGLWLDVPSVPGSLTILQGSVCYYFDPGDAPIFLCPGTKHSGWTAVTGCSDAACSPVMPCSACTAGTTPSLIRFDLSNYITALICNLCNVFGPGSSTIGSGTGWGIYDLLPTGTACQYEYVGPSSVIITSYPAGACGTVAPNFVVDTLRLRASIAAGGGSVLLSGAVDFHDPTFTHGTNALLSGSMTLGAGASANCIVGAGTQTPPANNCSYGAALISYFSSFPTWTMQPIP